MTTEVTEGHGIFDMARQKDYSFKWMGNKVDAEIRGIQAETYAVVMRAVAMDARRRVRRRKLNRPGGHWRDPGALSHPKHLVGGGMKLRDKMPAGGFVWAEWPAPALARGHVIRSRSAGKTSKAEYREGMSGRRRARKFDYLGAAFRKLAKTVLAKLAAKARGRGF